jgi:superfamily II DNA or RNA helicase
MTQMDARITELVARLTALEREGEVDDIVGNYGHLVVDECHHLSAVSFELVARRSKARYILGPSATVTRKDGHHPIIVMQCGPVRHRVDARTEAAKRPFDHVVRIRDTSFQLQTTLGTPAPSIQDVLKELVDDESRNDLIFDDVLRALEEGRSPVVITERIAHLETIAKRLEHFARHVVVLRGGQSEKQRRDIAAARSNSPRGGTCHRRDRTLPRRGFR